MRTISIGFPSMTPKLTMWEGTEDEEQFVIKGLKTKPYIKAYGIRYDLTAQEVKTMKHMLQAMQVFKGGRT